MALTYRVIARGSNDGPLVEEIGFADLAYLVATNPNRLVDYMNRSLTAAQTGLPEGARVEMKISGWSALGMGWAEQAAGHVQRAWEQGKLVDVDTKLPVEAWPEYPAQIAWGDSGTDTMTIRTVKNAIPAVAVWIVVGLLALFAVYEIWQFLRRSGWVASYADPFATPPPGGSPPGSSLPSGTEVLAWIGRHWAWVVLGGGALAAAPFVLRQIAGIKRARSELELAERYEQTEMGDG